MLKRLPVLLRNNLSFPEPGTCLPVVILKACPHGAGIQHHPPMLSLQGQLSRRVLVRVEQEQEDRELNAWTTPAIIAAKPNSASKSPS
jgi:hypothetical protein